MAGAASAQGLCRLEAEALAALPGQLAGEWQGRLEQALAVQAGLPRALPKDDQRRPAQFAAGADGLIFADATTETPIALAAVTGADWDFAAPGESTLAAAELLAADLQAAHATCPIAQLPQFRAKVPMNAQMDVLFHAFVLAPDHLLMVVLISSQDPSAGEGMRAVVDFRR